MILHNSIHTIFKQFTRKTGAFSSQIRVLYSGFLISVAQTLLSLPAEYTMENVSLAYK